MRSFRRALHDHWFAPASLRDLALARIVVVAGQLFLFLPALEAQLRLAAADSALFVPWPALKILLLPLGGWGIRPDPTLLHAVWIGAIISGVMAILGLYTRPSMLVFAASNTLLIAHSYSYGEFHHPQALLTIALWVLALGPSGAACSLDDLKARIYASTRFMQFQRRTPEEDQSIYARWPLRVIQWNFVLAYLSAGMSKIVHGGLDWYNGYTLSYYFLQDGLRHNIPLGLWLSGHETLASVLSVGSMLFELTFVLAIFVPVLTWLYVVGGTLFHTTIYITMRAPFFQYPVLYIVFLENLRKAVPARFRKQPVVPEWTVIYDGLCPLCIRSMVILDYLDLDGRLQYKDLEREWPDVAAIAPAVTPEEARHAMHVVGPDGRLYRGFFAFRALARAMPALWPVLPFYYAPLATRIGPRIYDLVAGNRGRTVCRAETCVVQSFP